MCRESIRDLGTLIELGEEGEEVEEEINAELQSLEKRLSETELHTLFAGDHDANSAIVTIHPGAGGTESQDWAEMLLWWRANMPTATFRPRSGFIAW